MAFFLGDERLPARFWSKVSESPSGCWEWTGYVRRDGYGELRTTDGSALAHRLAYITLVSEIQDGLLCDHLCRNRSCVNPGHIEIVTPRENVLRGEGPSARRRRQTHCKSGHALSGENVEIRRRGTGYQRVCKACRRRWRMEAYERNKEAEKARMRAYHARQRSMKQ